MENLYGTEYTGKDVENGTEDMMFVIEPKVDGSEKSVRTIRIQIIN